MSAISCPAPDCDVEWPATTPTDVLVRLLDIHSATAHQAAQPAAAQPGAAKAEKVRRPVISAAGTSEAWAYFEQRWSDYKQATRLTGPDVVFQLLECCDEALRKDLTRTYGALASSDEQTVLRNIKTLAVRQENVMVARVHLQQMRQDRDEPVRAFAARLRGQAGVCNFRVNPSLACHAEVDYSNIMIRDVLIRGLEDEEIRLDILGESRQDMSLEDALQYVEAKESGKRSASRLVESSQPSMAAATSSYKRHERNRLQNKAEIKNTTTPSQSPCIGRMMSKLALIRTCASASLNPSPSAPQSPGATRWWSAPKNQANRDEQSISSHSIVMPPARHTTPNHPSYLLPCDGGHRMPVVSCRHGTPT
ncbi:hypothetical protein BaRGS_00010731 [Batillaria attramentaria]|uniref:Uncharacterized protein n=1 Tax=Batillaria attramentaria TaxID=370345 RepID=A0ABD0LFE4_9CAEN